MGCIELGTVGHSFGCGLSNSRMSTRTRSRAWFFTWNNPEEGTVAQLGSTFSEVEYVCQLERGEEGTPHLQGVIRFKNPREGPGEDLFGLCHWERCRNWRAAVKYCTKVESRIDGPWTNVEGLTWRETIKDPLAGRELYWWQKNVLELIEGEPDNRSIYWLWEPEGCAGKTSLAKHICLKYPKKAIYLNGCNKDILFGVSTRLEESDIKVAIFGLSRQDASYMSYRSLEQLKDGIFYSGKYESRMCMFNPPHVLVFANFAPDMVSLSFDRWKVINIGDSDKAGGHCLTIV